jgi:hypothetical protein
VCVCVCVCVHVRERIYIHIHLGHAVAQWLRHCATNRNVAGSIPDGPGVESASNRNECQEYLLGVKAAGAQVLQPCHLHVPIVLKFGRLNLLEP